MGFDCPDRFVVGYGLDFEQRYRNLADILEISDTAALGRSDALLHLAVPAEGRLRSVAGPSYSANMIEMQLEGVRVELPTNQPIAAAGARRERLPIWIGASGGGRDRALAQGSRPPGR